MRARWMVTAMLATALVSSARAEDWPQWPKSGTYVSGRTATEADVASGAAVFVLGEGAVPLSFEVPQYALWTSEGGIRVRTIVVQAERLGSMEVVALRLADGSDVTVMRNEVRLFGTDISVLEKVR